MSPVIQPKARAVSRLEPKEPEPPTPRFHSGLSLLRSAVGNRGLQRALAPMARSLLPIQRTCACGGGGDCHCEEEPWPVQRRPATGGIAINQPGDEYEREADRTADLVIRMPRATEATASELSRPAIAPYVQRQPSPPTAEAGTPRLANSPSLEGRLAGASASGFPLASGVRESMEANFGVDFSPVRVHTGPAAASLSDDLDAIAFTHGPDIYFAPGAYSPGTPTGQRLLAHELTHVVQQGGGSGATMRQMRPRAIQRAPNVETKRYYFTGGGLLSGKAVHEGVETRLLNDSANKNLIVEAPIPGGTTKNLFQTNTLDNFDVVGRADLYTSSDSSKGAVVGVRGYMDDSEKDKDYVNRKREYRRLRTGAVVAASGATRWQPDAPAGGGKITGTFPSTFAVADLKPLGITKAAEGWVQTANYINGMPEFAKQAKLDGALTQTGSVTGSPLTDLHIPDGLNYWMLETEPPGRPAPGNFIVGTRRYWVAEGSQSGLYFYFDLSDPAPSRQARVAQERTLAQLQPVRRGLRFPEPGPSYTVQLTRRRTLAAPARPAVQRQPAGTRPTRDWKAEGETWEQGRSKWDTTYAKPFLKTSDAKFIHQRVEIEQHLKGGLKTAPFSADAKGFKAIEMWSGVSGKLFGWLRFKFGATFDKVVGFYDRIKEKFKSLHGKVTGIEATGLNVGWKRKLVGLLLKALKIGFVQLLKTLYEFFATCVQGLLNKVVRRFTEDLSEELSSYMEDLHKKWEEYSTKFKEEFESRFGRWDTFIEDLKDVAKWGQIASDLITMIRLGVQVISCLSPPALGCLWGLVVQLAIEGALDLVIGTPWFDRNIVKPTIRNLIKRFAGPAFQGLLDDALDLVHLTEFAADVRECHQIEDSDHLTEQAIKVIPESTMPEQEIITRRDKWYRDHADEVRDAQGRAGGGGSPPDAKKIAEESEKTQKKIRVTLGWPDQKKADELWFLTYPIRDKIGGASGGAANGGEISELTDAAAKSGMTADEVKAAIANAPKRSDGRAYPEWLRKLFGGGKGKGSGVATGTGAVAGGGAGQPGGSGAGSGTQPPTPASPVPEDKDKPSRGIPPLSIRKRYQIPDPGGERKIEPGPQIFAPPPGQPEKDPTVLPGVKIPLGR
jgi:hypothetical protein